MVAPGPGMGREEKKSQTAIVTLLDFSISVTIYFMVALPKFYSSANNSGQQMPVSSLNAPKSNNDFTYPFFVWAQTFLLWQQQVVYPKIPFDRWMGYGAGRLRPGVDMWWTTLCHGA